MSLGWNPVSAAEEIAKAAVQETMRAAGTRTVFALKIGDRTFRSVGEVFGYLEQFGFKVFIRGTTVGASMTTSRAPGPASRQR
jgi:hypothetical protein